MVPKEVVLMYFGGVLAISPNIYSNLVSSIATQYNVDKIELSNFIIKVLQEEAVKNPIDLKDW